MDEQVLLEWLRDLGFQSGDGALNKATVRQYMKNPNWRTLLEHAHKCFRPAQEVARAKGSLSKLADSSEVSAQDLAMARAYKKCKHKLQQVDARTAALQQQLAKHLVRSRSGALACSTSRLQSLSGPTQHSGRGPSIRSVDHMGPPTPRRLLMPASARRSWEERSGSASARSMYSREARISIRRA